MRALWGGIAWIAPFVAALVVRDGLALAWRAPAPYVTTIETSMQAIALHPFQQGYALHAPGPSKTELLDWLRREVHHPYIGIKSFTKNPGFGLNAGSSTQEFHFQVSDIPICLATARAHTLANGQTLFLGTVPKIGIYEAMPSTRREDWPDLDLSFKKAATAFDTTAQITLKSSQRCFYLRFEQLLPVYELLVSVDGLPWTIWTDAYEVFKQNRNFFDLDGTALVHPQNITSGRREAVKLKNLVGDGTLTSDYIKTAMPNELQSAVNQQHAFNYTPPDERYDEVAAFYYAQRHHDYLQRLGFNWYGPKPLLIKLHVRPAGRPNNALFTPAASDSDLPSIQVHGGDGIDLQNLTNDADVISHEFGHHVIYQTLRTTEGESLVLHEGLADFFAFAHSGDGCLGESICPATSRSCVVRGRCLRTADRRLYDFDLIYQDQLWNSWAGSNNRLGHLHGQLISGLLWDLRQGESFPVQDLAKLAMRAVTFLKSDSGFRDFMLALFFADRVEFQGKYFNDIYEAGVRRGLGTFFDDVSPETKKIPNIEGQGGIDSSSNLNNQTQAKPGTTRSNRGKNWSCGSIGMTTPGSNKIHLALIFLPLLLAAWMASRQERKRAHNFNLKLLDGEHKNNSRQKRQKFFVA